MKHPTITQHSRSLKFSRQRKPLPPFPLNPSSFSLYPFRLPELALLFFAAPLLFVLGVRVVSPFILLYIITIGMATWLVLAQSCRWSDFAGGAFTRNDFAFMLARFSACSILLLIVTWHFLPERLFAFPAQRPGLWLLVMLLYPILSAWPQEIAYRLFYFRRYGPALGTGLALLITNAVAFAWLHIVFENAVAVVLSLIGGLFYADTYRRTRSMALVTIEHSLYGQWIFTVGIGWYFYMGAIAR